MDVLIKFGFSIEDIKNMMNSNKEIELLEKENIYDIIYSLECVGCSNSIIKDVFITNPFCLNVDNKQIKKLIDYLYKIGLNDLYLIFSANPYILNFDYKYIEKFCNIKKKIGLSKQEICDIFYYSTDEII